MTNYKLEQQLDAAKKIPLSYESDQYETMVKRFLIPYVERILRVSDRLHGKNPFDNETWKILSSYANSWWHLGREYQYIARKLFPDEKIFDLLDKHLEVEGALISLCKTGSLPLNEDVLPLKLPLKENILEGEIQN